MAKLRKPGCALRSLELMGGADAALVAARQAGQDGDPRWALHLLALRAGTVSHQQKRRTQVVIRYRLVPPAVKMI